MENSKHYDNENDYGNGYNGPGWIGNEVESEGAAADMKMHILMIPILPLSVLTAVHSPCPLGLSLSRSPPSSSRIRLEHFGSRLQHIFVLKLH